MRTGKLALMMSLLLASSTAFAVQALVPGPPAVLETGKSANAVSDPMVGMKVLGRSREFLGTLVAIDRGTQSADLKTSGGAVVPVPMAKLSKEEDHLRALDLSAGDVLALIRQTGQSGVFEVKAPATVVK
jgi:hypothetical protein